MRNKILSLLALLLTAVTGAWAQSYEAKVFDVPASWTEDETYLSAADLPKDFVQITKDEAKALAVPDGIVILVYGFEGENVKVMQFVSGTAIIDEEEDDDGAPEVRGQFIVFQTLANAIICYPAPAGPKVAWNAATKTGTFAMPGSDVVLTPIYAKAAAFATTGTEPEVKTLLPAAAEGVIAGTDDPLIVEGIVAKAGETENPQGTVMYAVTAATATEAPALTAFSATVPTAEDYDDAATVYVWYYIQGADAPEGVAATLDNTFENTEICTTPLTVQVLTNKFDIQFNAANANTIEAGNATVTVGGTAATVTEGKLQGVKMGSEVKVKANTGYKFRKVEVKKKAEVTYPLLSATTTDDIGKVVCAAGHLHDAKTAVPDGCTAVGIVGKVTSTGHGLILALKDATSQNWNTINGWTSASYAGTTLKVLPDAGARGNLSSYEMLGETTVSNWCVAQKSDYEPIFQNLGSTKHDQDGYTYDGNVNAYITGAGGTAISGGYWSATHNGNSAWGFFTIFWSLGSKANSFSVRPVLGF